MRIKIEEEKPTTPDALRSQSINDHHAVEGKSALIVNFMQ